MCVPCLGPSWLYGTVADVHSQTLSDERGMDGRISIRLPAATLQQLAAMADQEHRSIAGQIRFLIDQGVRRTEKGNA